MSLKAPSPPAWRRKASAVLPGAVAGAPYPPRPRGPSHSPAPTAAGRPLQQLAPDCASQQPPRRCGGAGWEAAGGSRRLRGCARAGRLGSAAGALCRAVGLGRPPLPAAPLDAMLRPEVSASYQEVREERTGLGWWAAGPSSLGGTGAAPRAALPVPGQPRGYPQRCCRECSSAPVSGSAARQCWRSGAPAAASPVPAGPSASAAARPSPLGLAVRPSVPQLSVPVLPAPAAPPVTALSGCSCARQKERGVSGALNFMFYL